MDLRKGTQLSRREALLLSASAGVGLTFTDRLHAMQSTSKTALHQKGGSCTTPLDAVVKTQYGKVRGYVSDGVYTFKGVPYGQDTAAENRWLPAKAPTPWKDEYPTLVYGANCPQTLHNFKAAEMSFLYDWTDGYMSEDMLKLNIWTPSTSGKRPVMVYFHGGGFAFGSAYELSSHDGAQMARHHDVVQVSVNHRLNILGFLDLTEVGGSAYEDSANVGMTDLVASLRWIRENIASFGGDPNNIMIYGQSGGGSKVTCLMGMPSISGLIHRAGVQSGGGGNSPSAEQSKELTRQVMKELGLGKNDIQSLQKMEWSKLFAAGNAAIAKINPPLRGPGGPGSNPSPTPRVGWGPTVDGRAVTIRSFYDVAPEVSKNVPLLIGSVSEEGMQYHLNPAEAEWQENLTRAYGSEKATALIAGMKKAHPEKTIRTLSYGVQGLSARNNVQRMVKLKHEQQGAKAYQYWFTWQSPMLNGECGAWHTAELAFCFDNTKRCEQGTGNTPEAQSIAKKMSSAWANFARSGDPSQPGLAWTPSDPSRCQTMIFDKTCRMADDPDGSVRKILLS